MVVHPERRKGTWATPLALFSLSIMFGVIGWGGDQVFRDLRESIADIKSNMAEVRADVKDNTKAMWAVISKNNDTVHCIENHLANCCHDSVNCG